MDFHIHCYVNILLSDKIIFFSLIMLNLISCPFRCSVKYHSA